MAGSRDVVCWRDTAGLLHLCNPRLVQACLFPSGHVAAVIATALAVREFLPRLGIVFIIVALSISAATVYGRYHYAVDAVAGGLVALLAYQVSNRIQGKR